MVIVLMFDPVIGAPPRVVIATPLLIGARIVAGSNYGQVLGDDIIDVSCGPPILQANESEGAKKKRET
jgi:hypothetical protein